MKAAIERKHRLLNMPLEAGPRVLLVAATLSLVATCFLPIWKVAPAAPGSRNYEQLESGQRADIDPTLDVAGPRELPTDFPEFGWFPFALGVLGLLFLRAAVLGTTATLVDVSVLFVYVALFLFWSLRSRFSQDGQSDPGPGAYVLALVGLVLGAALFVAWRQSRCEIADDVRMAG